jgi:predicted AAA+ superfamily ATPase
LRGHELEIGLHGLIARMEVLMGRLEKLLPAVPAPMSWGSALAFRWRKRGTEGYLQPVSRVRPIKLSDLQGIEAQKAEVVRNTLQFLRGVPANNVLLWGSRGTGKSALVRALLNEYASEGLRLVEVEKYDLIDLPDIVDLLYGRRERLIVFCDDLSFEADEPGYKALKTVLDGSISAAADNVLIYATSNRRHLMPEFMDENLETRRVQGEIHPGEATEEKISLSERFGLCLSFYPFSQDDYLRIVYHWLGALGVPADDPDAVEQAALRWALARGSRSGRVAWQFAQDWAGRTQLKAGL